MSGGELYPTRAHSLAPYLGGSIPVPAAMELLKYDVVRAGAALESAGFPADLVFFPDTAFLSLIATGPGGQSIGVGYIGYGSASGLGAVLGFGGNSMADCVPAVPGAGWFISVRDLKKLADQHPDIRTGLTQMLRGQWAQGMATTLALTRLQLVPRVAWWLHEAANATGLDKLVITHDRLASLFGVRRPSVSLALQTLEEAKAIEGRRGSLRVLNSATLRQIFSPPADRGSHQRLAMPRRMGDAGRAKPSIS